MQRLTQREDLAMRVIRARVLTDLGRLDEAEELLAGLNPTLAEVAASRWWLATARQDADVAKRRAREWDLVSAHPLRTLDQLRPQDAP